MITTDIIIISCLVLSAFFSGIEIAYVSANRIFLEIPVDKLIDSIAKVDLSYDNGKTYTNDNRNCVSLILLFYTAERVIYLKCVLFGEHMKITSELKTLFKYFFFLFL